MIASRKARRLLLFLAVGLALAALVDLVTPGGEPRIVEASPTPIVAPVRVADLLPAATGRAEEVQRAAVAQLATHGGSDPDVPSDRSADEGSGAVRSSDVPDPADTPLPLERVEDLDLAAIAACWAPCFGERLAPAEVEALALTVTGDAGWSAWAGGCFTGGGENLGYVGAVGGPNRDGSFDLGIGQNNTRTLAWLGYEPARVLTDAEYALEALYATWLVQGYDAWRGC